MALLLTATPGASVIIVGGVDRRLAEWATPTFATLHDASWRMGQDGYQATQEHKVMSCFAISNGFLGVRTSWSHELANRACQ